jgi:hypothetical protein
MFKLTCRWSSHSRLPQVAAVTADTVLSLRVCNACAFAESEMDRFGLLSQASCYADRDQVYAAVSAVLSVCESRMCIINGLQCM